MGVILSTLPFLSAFQIPNLSATSVLLISGSITTAVFCWSGIDGQEPPSAGSALLGSVSRAQSFIQIRAEHTYEGDIKHSLDDDWCHAVRTLDSCVSLSIPSILGIDGMDGDRGFGIQQKNKNRKRRWETPEINADFPMLVETGK